MELGIYSPFIDLTHIARKVFFLWIGPEDGTEMAAPRCCCGVAEKLSSASTMDWAHQNFFLLLPYRRKPHRNKSQWQGGGLRALHKRNHIPKCAPQAPQSSALSLAQGVQGKVWTTQLQHFSGTAALQSHCPPKKLLIGIQVDFFILLSGLENSLQGKKC